MMAEILGKATGCSRGRGGSMHLIAPEVGMLGTVPIVAATISLAVGAGLSAKLKGEDRVSVTFFGDGAIEEGTFHESMNLAAAHRLPVLFVCENNFYSSHLSLLERRAQDNIVMTAASHGMPGVREDGNDVLRVHAMAAEAVARARGGGGPSFLELRTYRWRGHVGPSWDTDVGVKRKDELGEWLKKDPVTRLRSHLVAHGVSATRLETLECQARGEVEDALRFARESPYPSPEEVTKHVFKDTSLAEFS
jgi:pyruvate dehydrogenase E1 component alpha subunit